MILVNSKTNTAIGVFDIPGRKKPCLCIRQGNALIKYASFNNDLAATEFMEKLSEFIVKAVKADGE